MADRNLTIGSRVTISFDADHTNEGHSVMLADFIPDVDLSTSVPIMPGQSEEITFEELPSAEQLSIHVELPFNGSGVFKLEVDGKIRLTETIESDTNWDYLLNEPEFTTETLATNEEE